MHINVLPVICGFAVGKVIGLLIRKQYTEIFYYAIISVLAALGWAYQ